MTERVEKQASSEIAGKSMNKSEIAAQEIYGLWADQGRLGVPKFGLLAIAAIVERAIAESRSPTDTVSTQVARYEAIDNAPEHKTHTIWRHRVDTWKDKETGAYIAYLPEKITQGQTEESAIEAAKSLMKFEKQLLNEEIMAEFDGEPSPRHCPHCEAGIPRGVNQKTGHFNEGQFAGWCRYMVSDADYRRMYSGGESGAAQEVSPRCKAMQAAHEIEETCIEQDDSGHRFEVSRAAAIIGKLSSPAYPVEIEKESDGRWICEIAWVPGVMAYGETPSQALINAVGLLGKVESEGDTRELKAALKEALWVMNTDSRTGWRPLREAIELAERLLG